MDIITKAKTNTNDVITLKIKTSKLVLMLMAALLIAFVIKMINLYEVTGAIPDTLVTCVLGSGLAELALTAWITVSKVKKGTTE